MTREATTNFPVLHVPACPPLRPEEKVGARPHVYGYWIGRKMVMLMSVETKEAARGSFHDLPDAAEKKRFLSQHGSAFRGLVEVLRRPVVRRSRGVAAAASLVHLGGFPEELCRLVVQYSMEQLHTVDVDAFDRNEGVEGGDERREGGRGRRGEAAFKGEEAKEKDSFKESAGLEVERATDDCFRLFRKYNFVAGEHFPAALLDSPRQRCSRGGGGGGGGTLGDAQREWGGHKQGETLKNKTIEKKRSHEMCRLIIQHRARAAEKEENDDFLTSAARFMVEDIDREAARAAAKIRPRTYDAKQRRRDRRCEISQAQRQQQRQAASQKRLVKGRKSFCVQRRRRNAHHGYARERNAGNRGRGK